MPAAKRTDQDGRQAAEVFSVEERAAMREAVRERSARARGAKVDGETEVLRKIGEMQGSDRVMAERVHAIIKANAPALVPRTWYGMPAYSKDDRVLCFFRCAAKFKTRYATLGFSDEAKLDEGLMWPTDFAVTKITPTEEARIAALVRKAVG